MYSFMTKLPTVFSIFSIWLYQSLSVPSKWRHTLWKAICKANDVSLIEHIT